MKLMKLMQNTINLREEGKKNIYHTEIKILLVFTNLKTNKSYF